MQTRPQLRADLKMAEWSNRPGPFTAYKDSLGNWTAGYGHLLDQTIDWTGYTISQDAADGLLDLDIADREAQAQTLPEWPALDTECRQNAVIECIFNLGLAHWVHEFPKTRASIQASQWIPAATNLLNSPAWIAQVGRRRVERIAGYLQSGSYSLRLASALPL